MNLSFWKGKRVFITGHTGFKGSWLTIWLRSLGADVLGYALAPPSSPSLFEIAQLYRGMVHVTGDVRDSDLLHKTMVEFKPEIVFHMAAQALVRLSYAEPVETYSTNVMGTVNLLEAVRKTKSVKVVVNVTSDKCYENKEWVWGYRESEAMGGYDPYSNSKGCAELVTSAYRSSFFNPNLIKEHGVAIATARAGNVIGGGDWAVDRLIPDIMRAIRNGESVSIRNPFAIRPWQHVLEPLSGYMLLAEKLYQNGAEFSEGWNFGPADEDSKPVEWIAEYLTREWGAGVSWVVENGNHPHEAHYLKLDCSKAKMRLNWRPQWNLEMALNSIIDWNKKCEQGVDMKLVTLTQIENYSRSINS